MNKTETTQPTRLEINAEQWRRDIHTFANTTHQALHGIVSQLTNQCSSATNFPVDSDQNSSHAAAGAANQPDQDRLLSLKTQLAERINRTE